MLLPILNGTHGCKRILGLFGAFAGETSQVCAAPGAEHNRRDTAAAVVDVETVLVLVRQVVDQGVRAIVSIRVLVAHLVQVVGHTLTAVLSRHTATVAAI